LAYLPYPTHVALRRHPSTPPRVRGQARKARGEEEHGRRFWHRGFGERSIDKNGTRETGSGDTGELQPASSQSNRCQGLLNGGVGNYILDEP
jgi:hypothetical protein